MPSTWLGSDLQLWWDLRWRYWRPTRRFDTDWSGTARHWWCSEWCTWHWIIPWCIVTRWYSDARHWWCMKDVALDNTVMYSHWLIQRRHTLMMQRTLWHWIIPWCIFTDWSGTPDTDDTVNDVTLDNTVMYSHWLIGHCQTLMIQWMMWHWIIPWWIVTGWYRDVGHCQTLMMQWMMCHWIIPWCIVTDWSGTARRWWCSEGCGTG